MNTYEVSILNDEGYDCYYYVKAPDAKTAKDLALERHKRNFDTFAKKLKGNNLKEAQKELGKKSIIYSSSGS